MALPFDALSTTPVPSVFIGGRALPVTNLKDRESGGIALSDPSAGLQYQIWTAEISADRTQIVVSAPSVAATTLYTGVNISEVSLTFDQNMRPVLAFVEDGIAKLRWFDTVPQEQVVTVFGADYITPRVTLDDKRLTQNANSDVILAYLRDGNLYHRRQRDRFQTELLLATGVKSSGIAKIGMGRGYRLQFLMRW